VVRRDTREKTAINRGDAKERIMRYSPTSRITYTKEQESLSTV